MPTSLHSEAYAALIDVLVSARKEAGLTQQQVADRLGKPQSFVSKVERGERRIDVIEFSAVAEAIGITPTALLTRLLSVLPTPLAI